MNKHGDYLVHLYNMADYTIPWKGEKWIACSVVSQKMKALNDSVLYRRWFQLLQFTLVTATPYGVPAIICDKAKQVRKGHTSSVRFMFHTEDGEDYIENLNQR